MDSRLAPGMTGRGDAWHIADQRRGSRRRGGAARWRGARRTGRARSAHSRPHPAQWRVEAYPRSPVLDTALEIRLALLAAAAGGRLIEIVEERLPERDWLAENHRAFPPLRIGRFFFTARIDRGRRTGRCDRDRDRRGDGVRHRRASLDPRLPAGARPIGAAPPLSPAARYRNRQRHPGDRRGEAAASPGAGQRHRLRRGAGRRGTTSGATASPAGCAWSARRAIAAAPCAGHNYDLIFANILARPLALMARDLARALAPGGRAVLSGLLRRQEPMVLAAHRSSAACRSNAGSSSTDGRPWCCGRRRRLGWTAQTRGSQRPVKTQASLAGRSPLAGWRGLHRSARASWKPSTSRPDLASGGFRYRRASDRRAPSARHRPARAAATLKRPLRAPTKRLISDMT